MWPRTISRSVGVAAYHAGAGQPRSTLPGWGTLASADPGLAQALQSALAPPYASDWLQSMRRADKADRSWALALPCGTASLIRRPQPGDACRMASFFLRTPTGLAFQGRDPTPIVEAVKDLLWLSAAVRGDAFILSGRGEVLGLATIEKEIEPCEQPLDAAWLAAQGVTEDEVCLSRMVLAPELRGRGLGHALKAAQVTAAGDAGYRAVAGPAGNAVGLAIAKRAGGLVDAVSVSGWCLVPTPRWERAGRSPWN